MDLLTLIRAWKCLFVLAHLQERLVVELREYFELDIIWNLRENHDRARESGIVHQENQAAQQSEYYLQYDNNYSWLEKLMTSRVSLSATSSRGINSTTSVVRER